MRKIVCLLIVALLTHLAVWSQTRNIIGKIVDQNGDPVPYASIKIKNSNSGVAAGADGFFKISAKTGDILEVTAVNFQSTEFTVSSLNSISIILTRTSSSLTDVVVTTALGIQRQAKSLGYATAKVNNKEIVQAKPISVVNGLTGKVSGLQISTVNNGLFAPTRVTLRGNRSLTGNNQPLIVVDGSIYYSDINTLNPEDISDVTVLKGSSASAVYGSDASNGVLVITTKKGTRGKSSITFASTVQIEKVSYMPDYQTRFGSNGGEVFVDDFNDLSTFIPYENQSYGPEYNGRPVPLGRPVSDGSVLMVPYSAVPNQKKDFFNTGTTYQQNLSFQSGDENGSFYLSMQDIVSKAIMPKDEGRRDIFRIGGTKRYGMFSANYSLAYTYKYTNYTSTFDAYQNMIETPTLIPLNDLKDWQHNKFADPNGYFNDYYPNPWQTIDEYRSYNTEHHVIGNVQLNVRPFKWLNLSYRASVDNTSGRFEYKGLEIKYSQYALTDTRVVYSNPDGTGVDTVSESAKYIAVSDNPHPASYQTADGNILLFSSDFLASFNTNFYKDFELNSTIGMTYLDNKINYTPINNNFGINNASGNLNFPPYNTANYSGVADLSGQYLSEARKQGFFGEAQVGYKGMAYVHGSFRTDIDSRLSKDNRYIPYYDIDGSVVLTEMIKALKSSNVINYAKIRYAHSLTGNVSALANGSQYIAFGSYATVPTYTAADGFPYSASGISGYGVNTTIANPNIKPEKVTEDEIGLDLGFLKDRITLGASVYKAVTTDGIVYAQVARSSGFTQALVNAAKTENKGLELDLHVNIIKSKNTTWNVGVNWTHNESKVLGITGDVKSLALSGANPNSFAVVGQPYPVIETYDWARDSASGKVIVDAITGLPKRSSSLSIFGQANPKDIIGLTSTVTWKNFTFSATADYRGGHKIYNVIANIMDHSGVGSTTAVAGRQPFVFPNSVYLDNGKYVDNTNINVNDGNFNFWPTLYRSVGANYVVSAAAWKLREVVISYNFPQNWVAPAKIVKNASLSVSGRNLIMLRPSTNKWTDPEFNEDNGNDVGRTSEGQAPPTRIFSATLSVTF
ncbi:MAG TPA: SusC/RagA family TonB-linked outer membrane protein [Chitinophagaceae bacterium]